MPSSPTPPSITSISQRAETSPHVATIVAVPTEIPVTVPSSETIAMLSSEEVHIHVFLLVFSGSIVTSIFTLSPTLTCTFSLFNIILILYL